MMDQSRLKATENYVYNAVDDYIGKGATCSVYKGIRKDTGEVHALKIFEKRLTTIAEREIVALRSLKHANIVDFIAQETDRDTGRVVAVMEHCEKSLFTALNEPENKFGLSEDEFIRFFKHIVEGMKHLRQHGFLHRDIKPGNILIVQNDDGSNVYKLSDFGTAKPVLETEAFQSLVGTEEYLHPNIFKAAFIEKGMSRQFDAAADLWSLGATLYHAATGKVPFQPHQGRNNRAVMFQMIAEKPFGVIAGEQRSATGNVIWIRELPESCQFSRWLKEALTDIFKHLMEGDPSKAMTFDSFFNAADDILGRHIVHVFTTTSARHFRLYMRQEAEFFDLQEEIKVETNIPPKDQVIYYEESLLRDIVRQTDPLCTYPKISDSVPLVLIRATAVQSCVMPDEIRLWYKETLFDSEPFFGEEIVLEEDFKKAKSICESIALIQTYIELGCLTQTLFEKTINRTERWKGILVSRLKAEVEMTRNRIKDLVHIHAAITRGGVQPGFQPAEGVSIENLKAKINSCSSQITNIELQSQEHVTRPFSDGCVDSNKCPIKIARFLQQAKLKKQAFEMLRRQRRQPLPYHEAQLHKFDRKQLVTLFRKSLTLWSDHCKVKVTEIHGHFLEWHSSFAKLQEKIEMLQKELRATHSAIKKYTRQFQSSASGTSLVSMDQENVLSPSVTNGDTPSPRNSTASSGPFVAVAKRRELAANLVNQLEEVQSGQTDMKRMISESDDIQAQSMRLMSLDDMTLIEIPSLGNIENRTT
ncbi:serine/threonine-protein kinase TBK1-like isoform X2 [Dreissena polymorpha]|uniref:serine/threonine-protein kinase TBK1-like isoform X2 n=1 Tax=Dreissena polymorpha TaxID=45954 RepID=UPI002264FD40|nr:serine/threonine-protein kinase TBK1-like isoform X2 [Dreissena polymorpha]